MNLIIDIGNTRTKLFVFREGRISYSRAFEKLTSSQLKKIVVSHGIGSSILSTVVKGNAALKTYLKKNTKFIELNYRTSLPVKNRYGSRETLGNDRIANASGALKMFPAQNCLVIDAGTCIKYDFVNARKEYLGGAISPGLSMRYRSLAEYTSQLPLIRPARKVKLVGTTTRDSILSGVQQGMLNEMKGFVQLFEAEYGDLKVILTGGDAGFFAHLFNFRIFAAPELTAIGLNEILQHNHTEK